MAVSARWCANGGHLGAKHTRFRHRSVFPPVYSNLESHLSCCLSSSTQSQRSRRGGGMGMGRRPAPAPRSAPAQSRPHSTQAQTTPAPMQSHPPATTGGGGGMLSGIGSTIAQGMAFGTGSAIAHRAVGAAAGAMSGGGDGGQPVEAASGNDYQQQQQQPSQLTGACANDKQMFYECLQMNKGDQQACSFLYDQLKQCQAETTSMSFQ